MSGLRDVYLYPVPQHCDACGTVHGDTIYDMATVNRGPWGNLCRTCATLGPGVGRLGHGLGQAYERQPDGRYKLNRDAKL